MPISRTHSRQSRRLASRNSAPSLPGILLGRALTAALAFCLAAGEAAGQDPGQVQDTAPTDFFDSIDVEIANVEVFVTDRRGNAISGLTAKDFAITQNGEPVEITNFYAASATAPKQESVADLRPMETVPGTPPRADSTLEQRLNLVIFVDNQNISPRTRNRVLEALRGSLFFSLEPGDLVTLASYDGSLQIRQGLSGDPRDLAQALDELAEGGAAGVFSGFQRAAILRELQQTDLENDFQTLGGPGFSGAGADFVGILQSIRSYTEEEYARTVATVNAMGRFVDTLSGLEGRKAFIYVSDGLSLRPGEALYQAFARLAPANLAGVDFESREFDATELFEALGKRANASRVTFYTMLAAGGTAQTLTPAERGAFFDPAADAATLGQVWSEALETLERSNFRGSMEILAESTGGLATLSTRNFSQALRRVKQDLRTYYSLGFQAPDSSLEDLRIRVEVLRDGLRVRHRESLRQRSPEERMAVRTRSALLFARSENPLGVSLEFGRPQADDEGRYLVPLFVKFPFDRIVLTPDQGSHRGQVSIYVGAREAAGGVSPIQKTPAPIQVPDDRLEEALGQQAGYRLMLHLKPGEHSIAVSVRDEISKSESTVVATIDAEAVARRFAAAAAEQAADEATNAG